MKVGLGGLSSPGQSTLISYCNPTWVDSPRLELSNLRRDSPNNTSYPIQLAACLSFILCVACAFLFASRYTMLCRRHSIHMIHADDGGPGEPGRGQWVSLPCVPTGGRVTGSAGWTMRWDWLQVVAPPTHHSALNANPDSASERTSGLNLQTSHHLSFI